VPGKSGPAFNVLSYRTHRAAKRPTAALDKRLPDVKEIMMMKPMKYMTRCTLAGALVMTLAVPQLSRAQTAAAGSASQPAKEDGQRAISPFTLFTLLDVALDKRVSKDSEVNYTQLKGDKSLDKFVSAVAVADLSRFPIIKSMPKVPEGQVAKPEDLKPIEDRSFELAFWVNAYNGLVLKTIADAYPINAVADIKDFDTTKTHVVARQKYSLTELRQKIGQMEPRALFALTDGTSSGPKLAPRVYRWDGFSQALEAAVDAFVNDARNVTLDRIQNRVTVNEFLAEVDAAFKPQNSRRKWDGIRYVLASYTDARANKSYFGTGTYEINFVPRERGLNNWTHTDD